MAWKVEDIVLFIGLGVFTIAATHAVGYALRDTLRLTQIHEEPQKQILPISQDTEDALDAQSLAVLAQGHDRQTSQAAIRILSDRFIRQPEQVTSLMRDLYSRDAERRARGVLLLRMLASHASDRAPIQFLLDYVANPRRSTQSGGDGTRQAREAEESFEEQEVRRRRREAVVFHDGGGPVTQDDIIQRGVNGALSATILRETFEDEVGSLLRDITAEHQLSYAMVAETQDIVQGPVEAIAIGYFYQLPIAGAMPNMRLSIVTYHLVDNVEEDETGDLQ